MSVRTVNSLAGIFCAGSRTRDFVGDAQGFHFANVAIRVCGSHLLKVWMVGLLAVLSTLITHGVHAQQTSGDPVAGQTLYNTSCASGGCHGATGTINSQIKNAANAGGIIGLATARGMAGYNAASFNATQENNLAAYIATPAFVPEPNPGNQFVLFNDTSGPFTLTNIYLGTIYGAFTGIETVSQPTKGTVTYSGKVATYTPVTGQCGTDSFTWRATGVYMATTYQSNTRTVGLNISNPAAPNISTSGASINGTINSIISPYVPVSTGGSPYSYAITLGTLPNGMTLNPSTGVISGTPTQAASSMVTLTARNCLNGNLAGQSGNKVIVITISSNGVPQAPLNVTATPNPAGYLTATILSTTGGSGNGLVSYSSSNGNCTISGSTLTGQASSGSCTVTATKAGDGTYLQANANVLVNLLPGQTIAFPAIPGKVTVDPPFMVSATGSLSGNPITFSASGVCTAGGSNGATITLAGTVGTCSVTANLAGNASYAAASPVTQSFTVNAATDNEAFPPNCQMPAGWSVPPGATTGWSVAFDWNSGGVCSLKSNPLANSGLPVVAGIQYTGTFATGNVRFVFRVSSQSGSDCLKFYIDGIVNNFYGSCPSGENSAGPLNIPITAGIHTLKWQYEKDANGIAGADAAWIDNVDMPITSAPVITSPATVNGVVGDLEYQITAAHYPTSYGVESCAAGLHFCSIYSFQPNVVSTRTYLPGTYVVVVSASNAYGKGTKSVTFNIDKGIMPIYFPALNNRLTTAPPFTVTASSGYEYRGIPITYSVSGVCTNSGTNGEIIALTGAPGTCAVTASTVGDEIYYPAVPVTQNVLVSVPANEIFPLNCALPAGWIIPAGADAGWTVIANESSSEGACSLKSDDLPATGYRTYARIQFTGVFLAGNVSFRRRVLMETDRVCLNFYIDGVGYRVWDQPACYGIGAATGDLPFGAANGNDFRSIPVTAGTHTVMWEVGKDEYASNTGGEDRAWLDEVTLPLQTLTVTKVGAGTGAVTSMPAGIDCGATCTKAMSGTVILTAFGNPGSVFVGWSGAGCSGTGTCTVAMSASRSVTATFNLIFPPGVPQNVTVTAGTAQATIHFSPPAIDGGSAITQYTATCSANAQPTRTGFAAGSPIVVGGLVDGVSYACSVQATNLAGTGIPSASVNVTPVAIAYNGNNVYSRKINGAAGMKDLQLNGTAGINGAITVEPRALGAGHQIVFRFNNPPTSVTSLSVVDATPAPIGSATASFSGNDLIITLTGIPDNQRVTVTATGVNNALTVSASMGFLVGDVTGSQSVNAADISAVKARVGATVGSGNNYLFDLDANNVINNADVSAVKARAGRVIP